MNANFFCLDSVTGRRVAAILNMAMFPLALIGFGITNYDLGFSAGAVWVVIFFFSNPQRDATAAQEATFLARVNLALWFCTAMLFAVLVGGSMWRSQLLVGIAYALHWANSHRAAQAKTA